MNRTIRRWAYTGAGSLWLLGWLLLLPGVTAQEGGGLEVHISQESAALTAGEWVDFGTTIRNNGATTTAPLTVHLSVASLSPGKHVDPEDWSPLRTQYVPALSPGQSVTLPWSLHVLFEGEFAAFVTVLQTNSSASIPAAISTPLMVRVAPDNILPMNSVIPVAILVPLFPLALLLFGLWSMRRRSARHWPAGDVPDAPKTSPAPGR